MDTLLRPPDQPQQQQHQRHHVLIVQHLQVFYNAALMQRLVGTPAAADLVTLVKGFLHALEKTSVMDRNPDSFVVKDMTELAWQLKNMLQEILDKEEACLGLPQPSSTTMPGRLAEINIAVKKLLALAETLGNSRSLVGSLAVGSSSGGSRPPPLLMGPNSRGSYSPSSSGSMSPVRLTYSPSSSGMMAPNGPLPTVTATATAAAPSTALPPPSLPPQMTVKALKLKEFDEEYLNNAHDAYSVGDERLFTIIQYLVPDGTFTYEQKLPRENYPVLAAAAAGWALGTKGLKLPGGRINTLTWEQLVNMLVLSGKTLYRTTPAALTADATAATASEGAGHRMVPPPPPSWPNNNNAMPAGMGLRNPNPPRPVQGPPRPAYPPPGPQATYHPGGFLGQRPSLHNRGSGMGGVAAPPPPFIRPASSAWPTAPPPASSSGSSSRSNRLRSSRLHGRRERSGKCDKTSSKSESKAKAKAEHKVKSQSRFKLDKKSLILASSSSKLRSSDNGGYGNWDSDSPSDDSAGEETKAHDSDDSLSGSGIESDAESDPGSDSGSESGHGRRRHSQRNRRESWSSVSASGLDSDSDTDSDLSSASASDSDSSSASDSDSGWRKKSSRSSSKTAKSHKSHKNHRHHKNKSEFVIVEA